MARIREFDPDEALEKALALFWRNGYAETTMRDLVAYTGVAHAGLYSAFGSKRALFKTALVHHRNTTMAWLLRDLESPDSGRAEVEQFFETVLHIIKTGDFENGCFMLNTGIAFGGKADDIMASVHAHLEQMVHAFQGALERARDRGAVRADLDPQATAEFLVSVFNGTAAFARARSPYHRIERSMRTALKELD